MARTKSLAVAVTAGVALSIVPAGAALAAGTTTCDAYSQNCTTVQGQKFHKPPQVPSVSPSTLPFTGADIAAMTVLGAAALAGGAGLVRAGRRRRAFA